MRPRAPRLSRFVRRHRRPLAAVAAALGVLLAVGSLRADPVSPPVPASTVTSAELRAGEVSVPAVLASAAIAGLLAVGDVVDVVGGTPVAAVLARGARVLEIPAPASSIGGAPGAVVVLAVREADALPVAQAMADGTLTVIIRSTAGRY